MNERKRILFISSYPPRECGIATYSQDLLKAMASKSDKNIAFEVCVLENRHTKRSYSNMVKYILNVDDLRSYNRLAKTINQQEDIAAIFIQHEFGLFGGKYGGDLLFLLEKLNKPVVTTFHTVLPKPDIERKNIVEAIVNYSEQIVVMTKHASSVLQKEYNCNIDNINVIPHGTHIVKWDDKKQLRDKYHIDPQLPVLSTFGLLSENKNIETAIYSLPKIKEKFPSVLYLILGQTHPEVKKKEGEKYRKFLKKEVERLGLTKNVLFLNHYLNLDELLEYLKLTDIYLFTSKDKNQAVSGTFAYAMSSACPVVATAIPHAKELLDEDTGILIDFENPTQMAESVINLLSDRDRLENMSKNAFHKTRYTVWENVAIKTTNIFEPFLEGERLELALPEISFAHLQRMTDKRGIIQFSKFSTPDISSGYTLDDNARAMIAATMHYIESKDPNNLKLIRTYLNFIQHCQQEDGVFLNYLDGEGKYHIKNDYVNLEDANGRAIWGLGYLFSQSNQLPNYLVIKAEATFNHAISSLSKLRSPRAIAFAIKGLYYYNTIANDPKIVYLIESFADKLTEYYDEVSEEKWEWFENYLTYANSTLPEAMLYAYLATKKATYKIIARTTFDFLLPHLFENGQIKVISNNGWFHKEHQPGQFGEQPIDVSYTIQALNIFYKVFKKEDYKQKVKIAFDWFLGKNHLQQIIYNPISGGCYDGLERDGVNLNQGAESTACYLMARMITGKIEDEKISPKIKLPGVQGVKFLKKEPDTNILYWKDDSFITE